MPTIHKIEFLYKEYKDMENSTENNSNKNVILTLIKKLKKDETFTSYPKHILETIFEIYEKKCREAEI
jgi:hypothetical protein